MDTSALENVATRANATEWVYGRQPGTRHQPMKQHARSNARYMLPVGAAPPVRNARLEDQILCALNELGTATERQVLELIARDRWSLAHKAFMQLVASRAIVSASRKGTRLNQRRRVESQPPVVLEGTLIYKRIASPASTCAYVRFDSTSRLVKVVAFGPHARRLWSVSQGSVVKVCGRWLNTSHRPYFRIYAFDQDVAAHV